MHSACGSVAPGTPDWYPFGNDLVSASYWSDPTVMFVVCDSFILANRVFATYLNKSPSTQRRAVAKGKNTFCGRSIEMDTSIREERGPVDGVFPFDEVTIRINNDQVTILGFRRL